MTKALTAAILISLAGTAFADPPEVQFPQQEQAAALLKSATAEKNPAAKRDLLRQFISKFDDTRYGRNNEEYTYYAGDAVGLLLETAKSEADYIALVKELIDGKQPRARAFALKALAEHYESQGSSTAAQEVYARLAGPDGEHEISWNESFSMLAKHKLWAASPEGIKAAKDDAERIAAWQKEQANRIPASAYSGPGYDSGPKEDLYRFALISAAILTVMGIYLAFRVRKRSVP